MQMGFKVFNDARFVYGYIPSNYLNSKRGNLLLPVHVLRECLLFPCVCFWRVLLAAGGLYTQDRTNRTVYSTTFATQVVEHSERRFSTPL